MFLTVIGVVLLLELSILTFSRLPRCLCQWLWSSGRGLRTSPRGPTRALHQQHFRDRRFSPYLSPTNQLSAENDHASYWPHQQPKLLTNEELVFPLKLFNEGTFNRAGIPHSVTTRVGVPQSIGFSSSSSVIYNHPTRGSQPVYFSSNRDRISLPRHANSPAMNVNSWSPLPHTDRGRRFRRPQITAARSQRNQVLRELYALDLASSHHGPSYPRLARSPSFNSHSLSSSLKHQSSFSESVSKPGKNKPRGHKVLYPSTEISGKSSQTSARSHSSAADLNSLDPGLGLRSLSLESARLRRASPHFHNSLLYHSSPFSEWSASLDAQYARSSNVKSGHDRDNFANRFPSYSQYLRDAEYRRLAAASRIRSRATVPAEVSSEEPFVPKARVRNKKKSERTQSSETHNDRSQPRNPPEKGPSKDETKIIYPRVVTARNSKTGAKNSKAARPQESPRVKLIPQPETSSEDSGIAGSRVVTPRARQGRSTRAEPRRPRPRSAAQSGSDSSSSAPSPRVISPPPDPTRAPRIRLRPSSPVKVKVRVGATARRTALARQRNQLVSNSEDSGTVDLGTNRPRRRKPRKSSATKPNTSGQSKPRSILVKPKSLSHSDSSSGDRRVSGYNGRRKRQSNPKPLQAPANLNQSVSTGANVIHYNPTASPPHVKFHLPSAPSSNARPATAKPSRRSRRLTVSTNNNAIRGYHSHTSSKDDDSSTPAPSTPARPGPILRPLPLTGRRPTASTPAHPDPVLRPLPPKPRRPTGRTSSYRVPAAPPTRGQIGYSPPTTRSRHHRVHVYPRYHRVRAKPYSAQSYQA